MYDSRLAYAEGQQAAGSAQAELAERVARLAPLDGIHGTAVPALSLSRTSQQTAAMPVLHEPSLCVVVQGRKRAFLNDDVFYYDALNYLVVSVTLPVRGHVIEASPEQPYLGLKLQLDMDQLARLLLELGKQNPGSASAANRGMFVARMGNHLLDAVLRLVRLLDTPEDIAVLGPSIEREIYYRVLRGELGPRLVQMAQGDGSNNRIVRAIAWLKQYYAEPLRIDELAASLHMSPSALHHRFKAVTAVSPLQYQKQLRLHEARRLMFSDGLDCAAAGHQVGYESPSQFSREYRRLFGAPPSLEIARLKQSSLTGASQ